MNWEKLWKIEYDMPNTKEVVYLMAISIDQAVSLFEKMFEQENDIKYKASRKSIIEIKLIGEVYYEQ